MKEFIVRNFPSLGKIKRWIYAYYGSMAGTKPSYSQHQEDQYLYEQLKSYDLHKGVYIDVGANHPVTISNSFLFYKKGYQGVIVEPNTELANLFKLFRPRDIVATVGCGREASFKQFFFANAPVISSFEKQSIEQLSGNSKDAIWKTSFLPILTLDNIMKEIHYEWVFFLSIDVEGLDYDVLQGATNTLKKVLWLIVEQNGEDEKLRILKFAEQHNFEYITEKSCNLILKNKSIWFNQYLK